MTITDRDMREQVADSLGPFADDHDIEAIVDEIKGKYGLMNLNTIGARGVKLGVDEYWAIVEKHAKG